MADVAMIRAKYPAYSFLFDDPEIGPLLSEAVDATMDAETFRARLMATNWWRTHSESQRTWYALVNTDRASADQQKAEWKSGVYNQAAKMGVNLTDADLEHWADLFIPQGIQPNDPRLAESIWQVWSQKPGQRPAQGGDIAALTDEVRAIAEREYMIPLSQASLDTWAQRITNGTASLDGLKSTLGVLAKGRFAAYADLFDQGITPGQVFAPYQAQIANELELADASQVDLLNDPRWAQVTGVTGPDGKLRPMTMGETIKMARSQEAWKQTRNGQATAATLTQSILKTFGEV